MNDDDACAICSWHDAQANDDLCKRCRSILVWHDRIADETEGIVDLLANLYRYYLNELALTRLANGT